MATTAQGEEIPGAVAATESPLATGSPSVTGSPVATGSPGVSPSPTDAPTRTVNEPPDGSYFVNARRIWPGQSVTLAQNSLEDDDTPVDQIQVEVYWGDGTRDDVTGSTRKISHRYPDAGQYLIEVLLSDGIDVSDGLAARWRVDVDRYWAGSLKAVTPTTAQRLLQRAERPDRVG